VTARPLALSLLALCLAAGAAAAHHGWGAYDAARTLRIEAPVEALQWQNPHVHVMVPHEGRTWEAVLAPPFRMTARGLDPEMIKAGTRVTVEGYPSTKVPTELRAERITVGGRTFELR
jgi:hypothetical protein